MDQSLNIRQFVSLPIENSVDSQSEASFIPESSLVPLSAHGLCGSAQLPSCRIRRVAYALNAMRARSGLISPIDTTVCTWLVADVESTQEPLTIHTHFTNGQFDTFTLPSIED